MTPARCDRCPAAPDDPCDGTLCDLAGTSDAWDRHIAGRAAAMRHLPPPAPPVVAIGPPTLPLAESIRRVAAINACPDRTPTPGCGCAGTATCARDGRLRSRDQCWECVARPADPAPR